MLVSKQKNHSILTNKLESKKREWANASRVFCDTKKIE